MKNSDAINDEVKKNHESKDAQAPGIIALDRLVTEEDVSVEKSDDKEFEEFKREMDRLFGTSNGKPSFQPLGSASIEAMRQSKCSAEDNTFKHYYGSVSEETEKTVAEHKLILRCNRKKVQIGVCSDTVTQIDECKIGAQIHIFADIVKKRPMASFICSNEFYEMFSHVEAETEKVMLMKRFMSLSKEQQEDITQQKLGKRYPLATGTDRVFSTREELRAKYDICKDTYTMQQQRKIEQLFAESSSSRLAGRDKSIQKLERVLNISSRYPARKAVHRKDIISGLDKRLYKLDRVKEKVATFLTANNFTAERGIRILLVGHPGTGKTTIARTIAETYGIPFDIIPLNSVISAIDLKGLDSSYDPSGPGLLVESFYSLGTTEAVIVLDEIDKMGTGSKDGNPAYALLDVLSDEHICTDAFLEMGIDTSNTVFIATANSIQGIPDSLYNRFEVIAVDDYEDNDKIVIAEKYLVPQLFKGYGILPDEITFSRDVLKYIVKNYCSDYGARMLKANIKSIICSIVSAWDEGNNRKKTAVTKEYVRSVLEKTVDEDDPLLIFARNKDKYRSDVRAEIKKLIDGLPTLETDPYAKSKTLQRIQYLTALVPGKGGFENFDVKLFYECVDRSHFGMDSVKKKIATSLFSKAIQGKSFSSERLLLVGGAGIGKTSICESIARTLNIPYVRISLNGINDESAIKGFPHSYIGADAGEIVRGLARVKTTKALVQLDEIDKTGNHNGVKVSTVLFDLLDNCSAFTDRFLGVPIDLSDVLFIATANDISTMEPWLLDRFTRIDLDGYTRSDKEKILINHLIPTVEQEYASAHLELSITSMARHSLLNDYCVSFGVRDLERAVRSIVADKLYCNPSEKCITIDANDVVQSMGPKPIPRGNLLKTNVPGFSKALAVTGGNCGISFAIEAAIIPGESSTCITGLPKESAIDSVKLAKTFIRLNYAHKHGDYGIHLHFGEGAVVKDGPSAGVAILIAMLSAVSSTPVKGNVAYTGEIDLFGNVFAIGGTIAKIQAAEDTGCEKVFIPYDNYCQLKQDDIDKFSVEIVPVHHVSEVIDMVLPSLSKESPVIAK